MTTPRADTIDESRLYRLRPASALARIHPDERLLPLNPALLLPHLRAPLLEAPAGLGVWLQPLLRAAGALDAPFCVGVEGDAGKGARGGLHGAVTDALAAARAAHFRRPLVLHARLGVFPVDDADAVDVARVRVLEAVDAGVTSAQLGGLGGVAETAAFLADVMRPLADSGLGAVVQLTDAAQAQGLESALQGRVEVTAWTGMATAARPWRAPLADGEGAGWLDITAALGARIRSTLADHPALAGVAALQELFARKDDVLRDRLETRLYAEVEDVLTAQRARGSAGRAMVALSVPEADMPFE